MSGLGKGVITASIAKLLQLSNYNVSCMKIDPYLNVDAGTMNPLMHGEVFVTDDGGECDMDIGAYERFLDVNLSKDHNLTTGKVFSSVIEKERRGDYLGQCVQIIPHVTDEIKYRIRELASRYNLDILVVECGGTVGDIESLPFLEAMRQMWLEEGNDNVLFVHVTLAPILDVVGEVKTKPTQHSVQELRRIGIQPDIIAVRSKVMLDGDVKRKIALFTNVRVQDVISCHDVEYIYEVPEVLAKQDLVSIIKEKLKLYNKEINTPLWNSWRSIVDSYRNLKGEINIAMVGKYVKLADSYVSVNHALNHAGANLGYRVRIHHIDSEIFEHEDDPYYAKVLMHHFKAVINAYNTNKSNRERLYSNSTNNLLLSNEALLSNESIEYYSSDGNPLKILDYFDGILVPGGFGKRGSEGIIRVADYARVKDIPYLGICFGFQLAIVAFARYVCMLDNANSTEIDENTNHPVVHLLPEQRGIDKMGGTMRLGLHEIDVKSDTLAYKVYNNKTKIYKRHRHRYELNTEYKDMLEKNGMIFSGWSDDARRMEILEIPKNRFYFAVQYHAEFTSRPGKPEESFLAFVKAAIDYSKRNKSFINYDNNI